MIYSVVNYFAEPFLWYFISSQNNPMRKVTTTHLKIMKLTLKELSISLQATRLFAREIEFGSWPDPFSVLLPLKSGATKN